MRFSTDLRSSTWGLPFLLSASWLCALWFVIAVALWKFASSLPYPLYIGVVLSGAGVFFGGIVAGTYLLLGIWLRIRWGLGLAALAVNTFAFWLFFSSLP